METNLDYFCNIRNAGCSTLCIKSNHADNVMGLALEREISNINVLFSDIVHPFIMIIGGDENNNLSIIQRLVLIYTLLDFVD
mmetsp:Transcript_15231/g.2537  ORF Transcript_15231/g.2537 Transcript_15231/m.2537 type:complete len:82 (+) Transcript_15231:1819-2064(+)